MNARPDITSADDVTRLISTFYTRVRPDPVIGHFFTELDFETHIPRIVSFWTMILFGDTTYQGNPMAPHMQLDRRTPMEQAHFDRWLLLFDTTVDELFAGAKAEEAKQRARTIAGVMLHKVQSSRT